MGDRTETEKMKTRDRVHHCYDNEEGLKRYEELVNCLISIRDRMAGCHSFESLIDSLASIGLTQKAISGIVHPPVSADLHLHSSYSDGSIPPRKLVWLAKIMGLEAIAITDHDSVSGLREAWGEGQKLNLMVIPAVELQTGRPGCEILCYFPNDLALFAWLDSERSVGFRNDLCQAQSWIHRTFSRVIHDVNRFLMEQGVRRSRLITVEEVAAWYSGQEPFCPGTLAILGFKRLPDKVRQSLHVSDPREFHTRVVTPALNRLAKEYGTEDRAEDQKRGLSRVFEHVEAIRSDGVQVVTVLAHPRELLTKGGMNREQIRAFAETLVVDHGLNGVEVNNSRDSMEDTAYWVRMVSDIEDKLGWAAQGSRDSILRFSYSSDAHMLDPGKASGEFTMAYGRLNEGELYRCGNLIPVVPFRDLWRQMKASNEHDRHQHIQSP